MGVFRSAVQDRLIQDRKSTRLNSSHRCISYAVFCLKKKLMKNLDSKMLATSNPQISVSLRENRPSLNVANPSYPLSLAVFIPLSGLCAGRFGARTASPVVMPALCGLVLAGLAFWASGLAAAAGAFETGGRLSLSGAAEAEVVPLAAMSLASYRFFFFFNDAPTTEIYTLSLHDALPI